MQFIIPIHLPPKEVDTSIRSDSNLSLACLIATERRNAPPDIKMTAIVPALATTKRTSVSIRSVTHFSHPREDSMTYIIILTTMRSDNRHPSEFISEVDTRLFPPCVPPCVVGRLGNRRRGATSTRPAPSCARGQRHCLCDITGQLPQPH
ncbi:hypothetical protein J6590_057770 [Homalodisca vitripennis]|nr:hypothetical protein J6590_057770 [Homalodisca vitripennis]